MRRRQEKLQHFQEVTYKKPSDIIIEQINSLIAAGVLKPGDILPSERALEEKFRVGRGYIREAIRKLEFYGILKTMPQRGTVVANIGIKALQGLILNVINLEKHEMESLIEARAILEINCAYLAAENATESDIRLLRQAHEDFKKQVVAGNPSADEDLIFHLKVAEISKNTVLRSLVSLLTPDILSLAGELNACDGGRFKGAFEEHEAILHAIETHNPVKAREAMEIHMGKTNQQFLILKAKK